MRAPILFAGLLLWAGWNAVDLIAKLMVQS